MNVYRVWIEGESSGEVCCVLVSAGTEGRAIELAKAETECFPELQRALEYGGFRIAEFGADQERASIC